MVWLGLHYTIWIVLVVYLAGMLLLGWWSKRRVRDREGYLLGPEALVGEAAVDEHDGGRAASGRGIRDLYTVGRGDRPGHGTSLLAGVGRLDGLGSATDGRDGERGEDDRKESRLITGFQLLFS